MYVSVCAWVYVCEFICVLVRGNKLFSIISRRATAVRFTEGGVAVGRSSSRYSQNNEKTIS